MAKKLTLEEQLRKKDQKIRGLRRDLKEEEKSHKKTLEKLDSTRIQRNDWETEAAILTGEIGYFKLENENLEKSLNDSRGKTQHFEKENQELKAENSQLSTQNDVLKEENRFLKKTVEAINALVLKYTD